MLSSGLSGFDCLAKPLFPSPLMGSGFNRRGSPGPFEARTLLVVLVGETITDQSAVGLVCVDALLLCSRPRH